MKNHKLVLMALFVCLFLTATAFITLSASQIGSPMNQALSTNQNMDSQTLCGDHGVGPRMTRSNLVPV